MAIIKELPGVSISVRIQGQPLPEYRDDDIQDPERTVSYMIEAMANQIFEIHVRATPEASFAGSSLAAQFYVDGKYVDGVLIDASDLSARDGASAKSRGKYVSSNMLRRYQFASREQQIEVVERKSASLSMRPRVSGSSSRTPDVSYSGYTPSYVSSAASSWVDVDPPLFGANSVDPISVSASTANSSGTYATVSHASHSVGTPSPAAATIGRASTSANTAPFTPAVSNDQNTTAGADTDDVEELGTIKIVICHVNKKEPVVFGQRSSQTSQISDRKQKVIKDKAGGLLVRFTAPEWVAPITTWNVDAAGGDENKAVTFVYHYRTLEMLDALGVLPKEDRPLPPDGVKLEAVKEEAGEEVEGRQPQAGAGLLSSALRRGLQIEGRVADGRRNAVEDVLAVGETEGSWDMDDGGEMTPDPPK
ncbi:hypothetical protein BST61_g3847 [Cercospora zeina]